MELSRFNELSPFPLSLSLSLSETHYLSVTTRFPTSHLTCLHRFERERTSGAIASWDLIDHHVRVSSLDVRSQHDRPILKVHGLSWSRYQAPIPSTESERKWGESSRENGSLVKCSEAYAVGIFVSRSAKILRERAKCLPRGRERSQSSQRSESEIRIPAGTFDIGRGR